MPRRAVLSLLGVAAGVALLAAIWFAAFHIGLVQRADQTIYRSFGDLSYHPRLNSIAAFIAGLCNPKPYVVLAAAPLIIALARRRLWVAGAIAAILLGANETTQLLKPLLAAPRAASLLAGVKPPAAASWPSGHATAAMSLALCLVLAAPSRWRPWVAALGAGFAVAVSYSFLTLQWHYPTDVLGGFAVAATWSLAGVAAVFTADARRAAGTSFEPAQRQPIGAALGPPAATLLGAVALAGLMLLARPTAVASYARSHESFVIGAAGIAALALTLATGVMLALRR